MRYVVLVLYVCFTQNTKLTHEWILTTAMTLSSDPKKLYGFSHLPSIQPRPQDCFGSKRRVANMCVAHLATKSKWVSIILSIYEYMTIYIQYSIAYFQYFSEAAEIYSRKKGKAEKPSQTLDTSVGFLFLLLSLSVRMQIKNKNCSLYSWKLEKLY